MYVQWNKDLFLCERQKALSVFLFSLRVSAWVLINELLENVQKESSSALAFIHIPLPLTTAGEHRCCLRSASQL